jgi:hypothetical protein
VLSSIQSLTVLGNIRVFCRVRPKIKEDGGGPMANDVVDYDRDDDGLIYVTNKARTQTFEVDKVFTQTSLQEEVNSFVLELHSWRGLLDTTLCDKVKFVCDSQQVGGLLQVLWFPPPIKLIATI